MQVFDFKIHEEYSKLSHIIRKISVINSNQSIVLTRDNAQVPPQSMPEISETHLYYTKVLLPPELIL